VPRPAELRRSITALAERGRPHRAFIWPLDVVVSDGEAAKTVDPGRRLAARAMTIGFGPARGRILGIHTAGTRGGAPAGEGER
jgi:hypothetical protein